MNWFEIYYTYLHGCKLVNQWEIPEEGWEWHHTLPQCLFGDSKVGLWLSFEQHSVASALQTLAFNVCCVCPWHFPHLSNTLKTAIDPIWREEQGRRGKIGSEKGLEVCRERKVGYMFIPTELRREYGRKGALTQSFEQRSSAGKKGSASTNAQLWQNTHPDFEPIVLNPGTLSKWQKARGIDFKNKQFRVRRFDLETTTTSSTTQL
jgi:hypothetical protein